jgi:hypothetical protein
MPDKNNKKSGSDDELDTDAVGVATDAAETEEEESEWEEGGGDTDVEEDF